MNSSNRCPRCGAVADHLLTDIDGNSLYRCSGATTTKGIDKDGQVTSGNITPCETIINQRGEKYEGAVAFVSGDGIKTLVVTNGKERR